MALDLPTLVQKIRTTIDSSDTDKADASFQKLGGTMQKVGLGLTAGLTVPLVAFGATAVSAASDLNESISKVNVVFGDSAGVIQNWSKTAATSMGVSRQEALEAAGTFGNLFRAMNILPPEAAKMSTSLVGLAGDLASFNNADPKEVLEALRAGLLGEAEPLRKFGVQLSAARIEAEAMSLGLVQPTKNTEAIGVAMKAAEAATANAAKASKLYGESSPQYAAAIAEVEKSQSALNAATNGAIPELTAAQKAQAAYSIIQKDTALAQGDFSRTSDGLANSQRILSAQFKDLQASLGQALLPAATAAVSVFNGLLQGFLSMPEPAQKLIALVGVLAAAIGPLLIISGTLIKNLNLVRDAFAAEGAITSFASSFATAAKAVGSFVVTLAEAAVKTVVATAQMVASFVATAASAVASAAATAAAWLVAAAPFIALGIAIGLVVLVIVKNWDTITAATSAAWDFITGITTTAWNAVFGVISNVVGQIVDVATQTFDTLKTIVQVALTIVVDIIRVALALAILPFILLYELIKVNWDSIVAVTTAALDVMKAVITTVFDVIVTIVTTEINIVRTVLETAFAVIQAVFEAFSTAVTAVWNLLFSTISTIVSTELAIIRTVIETMIAFYTAAFEAGKNLILAIWNALFGAIQPIVQAIADFVTSTFTTLWNVATSLFETGKNTLLAIWNAFLAGVTPIIQAVMSVFDGMWRGISSAMDLVISVIDGTRDRVVGAFNAVKDGVIGAVSGAIDWVKNNISRLTGPIGSAIDKLQGLPIIGSLIPGHAEGGRMFAGQLSLVGEKGPELVVAGSNSTVVPNDQLRAAVGSGGGGGGGESSVIYGDTNVTISLDGVTMGSTDDIRALSRELYALIDSAQRAKGTKIPVGSR